MVRPENEEGPPPAGTGGRPKQLKITITYCTSSRPAQAVLLALALAASATGGGYGLAEVGSLPGLVDRLERLR